MEKFWRISLYVFDWWCYCKALCDEATLPESVQCACWQPDLRAFERRWFGHLVLDQTPMDAALPCWHHHQSCHVVAAGQLAYHVACLLDWRASVVHLRCTQLLCEEVDPHGSYLWPLKKKCRAHCIAAWRENVNGRPNGRNFRHISNSVSSKIF